MRHLLVIIVAVVLGACDISQTPSRGTDHVPVEQRMAATPDPGFARAVQPRAFSFPDDHGPHPDFATEWWYFTGNLADTAGRRFGYQLTLFRVGLKPGEAPHDSDWRAHQLYMGHLAISDIDREQHHSEERFSRAAAGLAGAKADPLEVWLGGWSITGVTQQTFPLRLRADGEQIALDLTLERGPRPIVLQGERGLSRKSAAPGNASYYYSFTRLPTRGTLRVGDRQFSVDGDSWFDREWSSSALASDQAGWDWFALHLDDGSELMYYQMRGVDGRPQRFSKGIFLDRDGQRHDLSSTDVVLTPRRSWRADDDTDYPVAWQLTLPAHGIDLNVDAAFDAQEMRHTVRYWEGAVVVSGTHAGRGYLELSGYAGRQTVQ